MHKRRVILILLGVVVAGAIVVLWRREREPEYGGKRLSEWVRVLGLNPTGGSGRDALDAIRAMGTNAVPYLVDWVEYEPPAWKTRFYRMFDSVMGKPNDYSVLRDRKRLRAVRAVMALDLLGPIAAAWVRDLSIAQNDIGSPTRAHHAELVLSGMSTKVLPANIALMTNYSPQVRLLSILILASWRAKAGPAIPVLISLLKDPDAAVRAAAKDALRQLAPEALEKANE